MASSSDLGAGDVKLLKDQYNALRADVLYWAYVCVRDEKSLGADGGTFTSGDWRTRDINDEYVDTANICSISSNQITLPAGTYRCLITCPAYKVDRHQALLWSVTDGGILAGVQSGSCLAAAADASVTHAIIQARFTLAAQKVLEVRHRCETTRDADGFGVPCSFTGEIYTVAEFWAELV